MDKEYAFEIAQKYINFLIKNKYPIKNAYLYGSYIKGNFNENSDIDIAVVLDSLTDTTEEMFKLMKHRRQFDLRLEPHPFLFKDFNRNNPFADEILKSGIKII